VIYKKENIHFILKILLNAK